MIEHLKDRLRRLKRYAQLATARGKGAVLKSKGICPVCETTTVFLAFDEWLRDHYVCTSCGSIPRERALIHVIDQAYPNWRAATIHESSPSDRGASAKLSRECPSYIKSQWDSDLSLGSLHPTLGYQSENLECQTFSDESFDLVITQDVIEHVYDPERTFAEIARTLRPGGAHIFTVPIVNKWARTRRRAKLGPDGNVEHLLPAEYHGNPIDPNGSLVTFDWGFDICDLIYTSSGLITTVVKIDDLSHGIRAEYIEVLVSTKLK